MSTGPRRIRLDKWPQSGSGRGLPRISEALRDLHTLTNPLIWCDRGIGAVRLASVEASMVMHWSGIVATDRRAQADLTDIEAFIDGLYGTDLHAKRIASLAGATLGVMRAASLAVAMIGQALAQARGLVTKHAIKQVDRLLSNHGIDVWESFARWVPHQIGVRQEVLVAMDWTDFDHDDQATLVLSLVTDHGRAAPLLWISVWKDELTKQRNDFEDACLRRLADLIPPGCRVTILADRGFGDQKLFAFLAELGFGYVIRFRGNIHVTDADGQTRPAAGIDAPIEVKRRFARGEWAWDCG